MRSSAYHAPPVGRQRATVHRTRASEVEVELLQPLQLGVLRWGLRCEHRWRREGRLSDGLVSAPAVSEVTPKKGVRTGRLLQRVAVSSEGGNRLGKHLEPVVLTHGRRRPRSLQMDRLAWDCAVSKEDLLLWLLVECPASQGRGFLTFYYEFKHTQHKQLECRPAFIGSTCTPSTH